MYMSLIIIISYLKLNIEYQNCASSNFPYLLLFKTFIILNLL